MIDMGLMLALVAPALTSAADARAGATAPAVVAITPARDAATPSGGGVGAPASVAEEPQRSGLGELMTSRALSLNLVEEAVRPPPDEEGLPRPGEPGFDPAKYPRPAWVAVNTPYSEWSLRTNFKGSGTGGVSIRHTGYTLNPVIGPESDFQVSLPFDYEASEYNFRGVTNFLPGGAAPVHNTYQIIFAPNVDARLNEDWSFVGGAIMIWAGEYGTNDGEAGTYGGFAGAKYHVSENLKLTLGVSGITRLERPRAIVPIAGIEWDIDKEMRLKSEGNSLRFEYDLTSELTAKATISYESRSFRLDGDTPGRAAHGVWRDSRVPFLLGLEYSPHPAVNFMVSGGVILWQEFALDDQYGSHVASHKADANALISISMEFYF